MNRRTFLKQTLAASTTLWLGVGKASETSDTIELQAQRRLEAFKRVYFVESSNGTNPKAYIENHARALGPLQITPIVVRDVNRILKLPVFALSDRLELKASRYMFNVYCKHYYPRGTVEQICRLWYRGPSRKRQRDSHGDKYWAMCKLYQISG